MLALADKSRGHECGALGMLGMLGTWTPATLFHANFFPSPVFEFC